MKNHSFCHFHKESFQSAFTNRYNALKTTIHRRPFILTRLGKILIAIIITQSTYAQSLSGYVLDKASGERLPNVSVFSANRSAVSNEYGYFSLKLSDCPCELSFSMVGYATLKKTFTEKDITDFQTIELSRKTTELDEVTVKSSVQEANRLPLGLVSIPVERLKKVPVLFGETDLLKALTLTPGVAPTVEGTSGISVRGGSPDQNLILLDETPVYNVTHLFGLVSVFNPDAIKDIKLYKAGFPAQYGGRLSSVIDITSKEGSGKKLNKEFSIGLINSRVLFEGPLNHKSKNYGTFLAAARLSNLSLLLLPTYFAYLSHPGNQYFNYNLYDVNLKWNKQFKDHSQFYVNFYQGNDVWYVKSNDGGNAFGKYKINWGNTTASLRYIKPIGQKVFWKNTLAYTQYHYGIGESLYEKKEKTNYFTSRSKLNDKLFKSTLEFYPDNKNDIFLGGELTSHTYKPVNIRSNAVLDIPDNFTKINAFEKAAFLEWNTRPFSWLALYSGLRVVGFSVKDTSYANLEPRLSLSISPLKNTTLKAGYAKMGQFLHLLSVSSGGLPNDLWIPASRQLPFEKSVQYSAGISQRINAAWRLEADIYRKQYTDLVDYKTGANFLVNSRDNYESLIEKNGIGESYGFEFLVDKQKGRFTGWLGYTYAVNNRKYDNINEGRWFPANFDRRHTLNLTGNYAISEDVDLSANWVFMTGTPVTVPIATTSTFILNGEKYIDYIYRDRNNFRTPNYQRLDINVNFKKETRGGNLRTISLGVYNAYNHNNSFFLKTNVEFLRNNPNQSPYGWNINVSKNNVIPFLPYISYSLKFK